MKPALGKSLYAILFVLVLPLLLAAWARGAGHNVPLPVPASQPWGAALSLAGSALMAAGAFSLARWGKGLPMSPYPPPVLVSRGIYRLVGHPLYLGAVLISAGASVAAGSPAGLWLVTPTLALACAAWVLGEEGPALDARFGADRPRPLLSLGPLAALLPGRKALWSCLLRATERHANAWREWRWGRVRLLKHGFFGGAAAALGILLAGSLVGGAWLPRVLLVAVCSIATAGLWAQVVEGSPLLLRPFGYYGSLLGGLLGCALAGLLWGDGWVLTAAFAAAAPWIQATGRLRCLIQGCCHGRPASPRPGIVFSHPRSRVLRLAGLGGVPLFPTQLYSILWNLVPGIVLAVLWAVHAAPPLVAGGYLILAGVGRFVEESYRGEPQTARWGGMAMYQWLALGSVVLGAVFTTLRTGSSLPPPSPSWSVAGAAAAFGALAVFAYGVDFPESNRRFSRLV